MAIQEILGRWRERSRADRAAFARYLLSGGATLGFYILALLVLIDMADLSRALAVGIGMVLAGILNYLLIKWVVFRSDRQHVEAAPRYVAVLSANIGANMALTWVACDLAGLPYGPVQVAYFIVATLMIFFVMRRWVMFRRHPAGSDNA